MSWRDKTLLLGECKWGQDAVSKAVVSELLDKGQRLLDEVFPGQEWSLHHVLFARAGFTDAAAQEAAKHDLLLVSAQQLDDDLAAP